MESPLEATTACYTKAELEEQTRKCQQYFIVQRASACVRSRKDYVTAPNGTDCRRHKEFQGRSARRCNMIVYIAGTNQHDTDRACIALTSKLHNANPTLLLENRHHFVRCKWPEWQQYRSEELDGGQVADLVKSHLMLCDFLQDGSLEAVRWDLEPEKAALPSTQRAITMLFWPAATDDNTSLGHAAVSRTGDYRGLQSGPVSLESLREHALPSFTSTDDMVHVSLDKAAEFLAQLDHRETASNVLTRARNESGAEIVKQQLQDEAKEVLAGGACHTLGAEYHSHLKQRCHGRFTDFKDDGYSDLQAALVSRVALYHIRGVASPRVRRHFRH